MASEMRADHGGGPTGTWTIVWERRPKRDGWRIARGAISAVRDLAVVVGLVGAVLSAIFLLAPNLGQSTENTVEISHVTVEPNVTGGEYFQHFPVMTYLHERGSSLGSYADRMADTGVVVDLVYKVSGVRSEALPLRWTLFDARTRRRVAESESLDPLPISVKAQKKNADVGSWEVWIDTSRVAGRRFFARLELYDEDLTTRLAYAYTPVFAAGHPIGP